MMLAKVGNQSMIENIALEVLGCGRNELAQQLDLVGGSCFNTDTGNIGLRPAHASNQAKFHRIIGMMEVARLAAKAGPAPSTRITVSADKLSCEFIPPLGYLTRPAIFDFYVLPFNIPKLHQALRESR
jgi:hypothetical protein